METVGDRLKRCREDAGLTQLALAKRIGVTRSAIAQVEGGTSNSLNAENITKAAAVLGKNSLWLATGDGPENASNILNEVLDALPADGRQQSFDFLLYQIDRAKEVIIQRGGDYSKMIDGIMKDMERRKNAPLEDPPSRLDARTEKAKRAERSRTKKLI